LRGKGRVNFSPHKTEGQGPRTNEKETRKNKNPPSSIMGGKMDVEKVKKKTGKS